MKELTAQIQEELHRALIAPARALLGIDVAEHLEQRVAERAPLLATQLVGDDPDVAAETAIDLAQLLPDTIPAAWWRTPLGVAVSLTYRPVEAVSAAEAAEILGVSRGRVYQLLDAGKLAAATGGGVAMASVMDRIRDQHGN